MFSIHAPQSCSLITPGADGPFTMLDFAVDGGDTSRCVLEITTSEGDTHILTFNQRGLLVDQQFVSHDGALAADVLLLADPFVDGRDTRADNPYTHLAPTMHGDPIQPFVGHRQPDVFDKDGKPAVNDVEMRKAAMDVAGKDAEKAREERAKIAAESPKERQERLARKPDGDLKTADDTTAADVSWDAPHQNPGQRHDYDGLTKPGAVPDHGVVNTTETLGQTPQPEPVYPPQEPQHG
jgi:hypothetical protein